MKHRRTEAKKAIEVVVLKDPELKKNTSGSLELTRLDAFMGAWPNLCPAFLNEDHIYRAPAHLPRMPLLAGRILIVVIAHRFRDGYA